MITTEDIHEHQAIYPAFDGLRLIEWLTAKGKLSNGKFKGYSTVARANRARKRDASIIRYCDRDST